jgi:hypothetical protein
MRSTIKLEEAKEGRYTSQYLEILLLSAEETVRNRHLKILRTVQLALEVTR